MSFFRDLTLLRAAALLFVAGVLASCAHRPTYVEDFTPLDQRLAEIVTIHNRGQYEALRPYFAKGATIQLPATPRPSSIDKYIKSVALEPYALSITGTEVVYSFTGRAATRSTIAANSPGRFNIRELATIDWVREDGYWRISRIAVAAWPPVVGTWRRSGLRGEGSIELRIFPNGTYQVYLGEDYAVAAYRGNYTLDGNKITLVDSSANNASDFQNGAGSYIFVRTSTGLNLQKVDEDNTWRAERYEGAWTAARD